MYWVGTEHHHRCEHGRIISHQSYERNRNGMGMGMGMGMSLETGVQSRVLVEERVTILFCSCPDKDLVWLGKTKRWSKPIDRAEDN